MFVVMLGFTFFSASMWTGTTLGNGQTLGNFFLAVLIGNLIEIYFLSAGDWNFGSAISLIMALIIIASMWATKKLDRNEWEAY